MIDAQVGIIGAGPAGLIAAETLAQADVDVTLFEHRRSPANKFLLAGRGGLNITNDEPLDQLLDRYGPDRGFLEPAIRAWSPGELQTWIAELGEPAFVGSSGRVFPASMRATPLLRSWLARLDGLGVSLQTNERWAGFTDDQNGQRFISASVSEDGSRIERRDAWLFALGGASWPRTGADGSWVETFRSAGIEVNPIEPSNCGVRVSWTHVMRERFAGEPIKNVAVNLDGDSVRGDIVVTNTGLEGGPVYAHARGLRTHLQQGGSGVLMVDLHPDLSFEAMRDRLDSRRPRSTLTSWLRSAGLSPAKIALLRETTENQLPADATAMAELVKRCAIDVTGLAAVDRAISTAGGVAQNAVTDEFMLRSRRGTFVAGEMLDWDAPTGGYLLQASLSTGVAAARGMIEWLAS